MGEQDRSSPPAIPRFNTRAELQAYVDAGGATEFMITDDEQVLVGQRARDGWAQYMAEHETARRINRTIRSRRLRGATIPRPQRPRERRPGTRRRTSSSSRTSSADPGGDGEPPHLAVAPRRALYTYGILGYRLAVAA